MSQEEIIPCDGIMFHPPHPGEALKMLYLEPLGLSMSAVAQRLGVERKTISRLVNGHTSVSAEMAMRLARAFNTSAELWLNKQRGYDLWQARQRLSQAIEAIEPFYMDDVSKTISPVTSV